MPSAYQAFQFTHPGGVRPPRYAEYKTACDVSIHAPGRGATAKLSGCSLHQSCFNSRTREGCDFSGDACRRRYDEFQFTHPGGVRLHAMLSVVDTTTVSIHAPGRGATHQQQRREYRVQFQFTHPGGVRLTPNSNDNNNVTVSIHAPGRGATNLLSFQGLDIMVSIHAPGRGATVWCKVAYYGADKQA